MWVSSSSVFVHLVELQKQEKFKLVIDVKLI